MWTLAGTLRLLPARTAGAGLVAVLSGFLLSACGSAEAPQQVLSTRCLPVGGGQESAVNVLAPGAGTLRIEIEERGVSVAATLDDRGTPSASPTERLGTLVLLADARPGQTHSVRIRAEDSPDIGGLFCISAQLLSPSDRARVRAERAFAAAGRATHEHDWERAFAAYLSAARAFDGLGLRRSSGLALQAVAEIEYLRLDRTHDAFALANAARADLGSAEPLLVGALTGLEGKSLLESPGMDPQAVAPRVRERFETARRYDLASPFGAREIPRLDIMTGFLEYMLDAPGRANELFAAAARRCSELRDWDCYAIAKQNLAELAAETNNYAAALAAYADALRVLPPGLDPKLSADIWNNFGRVQGIVGLFRSAERSHEKAMRQYARLGDCPGVRRSLSWSGNLLVQIGTLGDAEDLLQQAASRDCSELLAAHDRSEAADAPPTRASPSAAGGKGDPQQQPCAGPIDASTLAIDNKMTVFNSLLSLGGALMLEGEPGNARYCFDEAERYAATARSQMRLANARGSMLLDGNDARGARAAFTQSLRIADEAGIPAMYEHRGIAQLGILRSALLAGDPAEAVRVGAGTLESSVGRGDIDQTVSSLRLLAAGYRASQRPAEAARTLETAADLIEGVPIDELDGEKRATFLATQYSVFAELTDLYASQAASDPEMAWQAFSTSERGRARSLRFAITQETRDASTSEAPPESRYQQWLRDIVGLAQSQPGPDRQDLIRRLDEAALRERRAREPFDRESLVRTLRQLDATLIEYVVGSRDLFAIVVNGGKASVFRLGEQREIAGAASVLHDRVRDAEAPQSEVRAAAQRLAQLVLWPLSAHTSARRVVFVPDDALHTVPFNVLPWSAQAPEQLVLQQAEVSVIPSALLLIRGRATSREHPEAPRIELIGDPVFRAREWRAECVLPAPAPGRASASRGAANWTESLPSLPGSRAEVQSIARLARQARSGSHIETLLGCAAVPSALRRAAGEHIDLLHIATHARVDAQRPRLSALALTPEGAADNVNSTFGLLDILGLKLSSSLVVLSACDTSRGRLLPGEGMLGPAQAFLQAGASAVLASYWRVDDQSTAAFMQRFYKYLLVERLPASTALRRAQLDQSAASASYDWAAFALYGWPDAGV